MKKLYKKKDIINQIQMIIQDRIDEVSGMVKPKTEKEALFYLLRRFKHVFTDFGTAINALNPEPLLNQLEPGAFDRSSLSVYKIPSQTTRTAVPGANKFGLSYKDVPIPFYKIALNISPNLKIPFMTKTFIDKNDVQFKQVGPEVKSLIAKANKIYEEITKNFSGYPVSTQTSLKGILNSMRGWCKRFEHTRTNEINKLISNIFKNKFNPNFIKKYINNPSEDMLSDIDLREILTDATNYYLPFENANQSIDNFKRLVEIEIKNKLAPIHRNITNDYVNLSNVEKMQFYGAEDDVFSLITKFILNDGQSFQEMNSRLVNYLGDYTDIDSSAEGTYLYNYKELLRLKHEFEQVNKKLENILNEKYRTESYREQESTERFSTAISLYESYSEKLYELLTGQIEENVKSLTFTLDDVKSEDSIDLKMESIYQQLDQSLRNNAKKVNDEMSKLDSAKKELKKQIIDFYIKSGSSYLDIDDPQSKLGKKLKMVDDLGNKFSELETEFFDIQDGVITKFILGACDKLIKMVEAEPKEKDAEQKIKQKIEKEFEVLIKDGKNVVFNNFQKKLNQFIEYYRKNYNKRYESEGFLLAPDYIVKYGENKYLKLEQEINQFLASPSLTMRNLLPRNLYVDFTDEFLRKPKERD